MGSAGDTKREKGRTSWVCAEVGGRFRLSWRHRWEDKAARFSYRGGRGRFWARSAQACRTDEKSTGSSKRVAGFVQTHPILWSLDRGLPEPNRQGTVEHQAASLKGLASESAGDRCRRGQTHPGSWGPGRGLAVARLQRGSQETEAGLPGAESRGAGARTHANSQLRQCEARRKAAARPPARCRQLPQPSPPPGSGWGRSAGPLRGRPAPGAPPRPAPAGP